MNFVSIEYLLFFVTVFFIYWNLNRVGQNLFLLCSSWLFYAWWDWRFLSLIAISTLVDYVVGKQIYVSDNSTRRRIWLVFSIVTNLGILFYFKYANFFIESFVAFAHSAGWQVSQPLLNVILPVGISFYTFQSLSYSFDIYRNELKPSNSLIDFAAFVAFFPQLVAGPIVRAKEFVFQLSKDRNFDQEQFQLGFFRFLYGFLLKAFVADSLGILLVDPVFLDPQSYSVQSIWFASVGYSVQIYADFAGYSSMAIGSALMLGFSLPENFMFPYLAINITDFWRRWHMTMSRFFRDYVYIGLGGSRHGEIKTYRNVMLTMLVSGLWHGAAWTFVAWGGLHGIFSVIQRLSGRYLGSLSQSLRGKGFIFSWSITMLAVMGAFVLFRATNFEHAQSVFTGLFSSQGSSEIEINLTLFLCFLFFVLDHVGGWMKERQMNVDFVLEIPLVKGLIYASLVIFLFNFLPQEESPFIYFQF